MRTLEVRTLITWDEKWPAFWLQTAFIGVRAWRGNRWSWVGIGLSLLTYGIHLMARATLQMNERAIRYRSAGRRWALLWDEIEKIAVGPSPNELTILFSRGEIHDMMNLSVFQGDDKAAIQELYARQIEERGITVERLSQAELDALMIPASNTSETP